MAHVQYQTTVDWDTSLKDVGYVDSDTIGEAFAGLVESAVKVTTGAPAATAGKFIGGAFIKNAVDSTWYQMTGTTATPVWTLQGTGSGGITQLTGDVTAGPGTGSQVATIAAGAVDAAMIAATFPFVGAALAGHDHNVQYHSAEAITVTAGTGVSSALVNPVGIVESVYITAGGVTGAVKVIPAGQTPGTLECTYDHSTGVFQFLIADAVTAAVVSYIALGVTSVSAGTPAGTITPA